MTASETPVSPFGSPFGPPADLSADAVETAPPSTNPETLSDHDVLIAEAEARYRELHDQHLRLAADFDNFRKRRLQEMDHQRKYGAETALLALLPVLDNLHRAQASLTEQSDPKVLFQSIAMLQRQLLDNLTTLGLQPIDPVDQPFDANQHEAVSSQPTADKPENTVLTVAQKGYKLHDRVIRPAQVIVAVAPDDAASSVAVAANPFEL